MQTQNGRNILTWDHGIMGSWDHEIMRSWDHGIMGSWDHGISLSLKKSMKYSGHRKLLCELSKLLKLNAFILHRY